MFENDFENESRRNNKQEEEDENDYYQSPDLEELKRMKLRKRISYWYLQVRGFNFFQQRFVLKRARSPASGRGRRVLLPLRIHSCLRMCRANIRFIYK